MTQKPPNQTQTNFQRMYQACARARKGQETNEDLLFMVQHPSMAQLIMNRVLGQSQL